MPDLEQTSLSDQIFLFPEIVIGARLLTKLCFEVNPKWWWELQITQYTTDLVGTCRIWKIFREMPVCHIPRKSDYLFFKLEVGPFANSGPNEPIKMLGILSEDRL